MKKFVVTVWAVFSSMYGYAQHEVGAFSFLPKVGINVTTLTQVSEKEKLESSAIGFDCEYQFSRMASFSVGLMYSEQGCKMRVYTSNDDTKGSMNKERLNYVNFPFVLNFYVVQGLAVKAGAQLGVLIEDKTDFQNGKVVDFSVPMGLSYEYKKFVVEARYNLGLTNSLKWDSAILGKAHNSVFQFTLGYKMDL